VHVERLIRELHWTERRRRYVQMVLVVAFELKLRILPEWQSEIGLLYRVAGLGLDQDDSFEQFDRDLAAVLPKIQWLADQRKSPRGTELLRR
jgi:hypothetical protein